MRKKIIIAIFLFVLINIGIKINNVQAEDFNFPNQIGPISRTSQAAFPTANGINYYGQTYKYDSSRQKAVFCVEYSKQFASSTCTKITDSSEDWSVPTKAGVATIIKEARFGNPLPSSITNAQLQTNLNITMAINQFLIDVGEGGYYNKIPYGVDVNQFISTEYRNIIEKAKTEYNRVKKALYGNSNEKLDVDVSFYPTTSGQTSTITYNPQDTSNYVNYRIFKIHSNNVSGSTLTAKVYKGGTIPEYVTLNIYTSTNVNNFPSEAAVTFESTSDPSQEIQVNPNSDNYVKFEIIDDRSDKSAAIRFFPSITAFASMEYNQAQAYDCGDNEQKLTPNILAKITKTENDSASMTFKTVEIPNFPDLKIVKQDKNDNTKRLSNARFNIMKYPDPNNEKNKIITSKNTDANGEINISSLEEAKYCIIETRAPSGYLLEVDNESNPTKHCFTVRMVSDNNSNTIEVDTNNDSAINYNHDPEHPIITLTKNNALNKIKLGKKVKVNGTYQYKEGAVLKLTTTNNKNADPYIHNNESLEWTTTNSAKEITGLPIGTYYLYEMSAPSGYNLNPDPVIIRVTATDTTEKSYFIKNQLTTIKIRKVDASTPALTLTGAKLQVVDSNNNVVAGPWTSANSDYTITGLTEGDYWLEEVDPPKGYSKTSKIKFHINEYGDVSVNTQDIESQTVVLSNRKNEVIINKTNITSAKTIAGAKLQILDSQNNPVKLKKIDGYLEPDDSGEEFWISSEEPETIKKLPAGKYKLKEVIAPERYVLSSEEIEFEITASGEVKINNNIQESKTIIITNDYTKVYISKQDITNKGVELPGATLVLENSDGIEIERWESGTEPNLIEGLPAGTYTLTEITAPDGYTKSEETITFTIDANGVVSGNTIMYNTPIPEVPNTLSTQSLIITIAGIIIVGVGVGLYIYGLRKKKDQI